MTLFENLMQLFIYFVVYSFIYSVIAVFESISCGTCVLRPPRTSSLMETFSSAISQRSSLFSHSTSPRVDHRKAPPCSPLGVRKRCVKSCASATPRRAALSRKEVPRLPISSIIMQSRKRDLRAKFTRRR